jgi:flagellin-like protein
MYNNKKGQSEIITTVLIILLVLAAIVIVWQVVRSTVTTGANQISGGTDCITLGFDITRADVGSNNVTVKRIAGSGDLGKLKLVVDGVIKNDTADASNLKELESMKVYLSSGTLATTNKAEIAAVLKNGKGCDVAASKTVI